MSLDEVRGVADENTGNVIREGRIQIEISK